MDNYKSNRWIGVIFFGAALSVGNMPIASAQRNAAGEAANYPHKPIRLIVPFAPNGPNDLLARMVGQKLTESWNQQTVIDNRPGAGTIIGTDLAARATPDGYTLLMISSSTAVNPTLKKKLPYDTLRDLTPVVRLASSPNVLVVNPSVPAKSAAELIALAKSQNGKIAYASGGTGTATHLAGELFCSMAGVKMTHVPYKGAGPATLDLLGGRVSWMFGTILPTLPHIRSGKLRAIGISSEQRSPALPDVPAIAETLPGFEATSFYGIAAPAGTPKTIVAKLNSEIARIIKSPEMREQLQRQGADAVGDTQAEFDAFFRKQIGKWARVIQEAGIQAD
ncbi:MAG TPA: tripartite tricarboxylate transporter substrate binding protein [Burkholderiales bacterium]|nr:tripartite tricarboxylate transporter substrate binding protein [Burkholderiales bacterium]